MKIAIVSLGCPKNQVDADVFCRALLADGHETVADPAEADAIIVNTCGFIQSAKEEAIENILLACGYKQQNPGLKVIVTGCLAERYKGEIAREMPEVDAVVGIGSNKALPEILRRVCSDGAGQIESYGPKTDMPLGGRRVISTIGAAEPIGPKKLLDLLIICPCTGNTLGKLAAGVTDSCVTMAAKAHLRNGRPLLIAPSTNDGLAASAVAIGTLLPRKHIYFVPFGQDDPEGKPTSLVADFHRVADAAQAALEGRQLQPLLLGGQ